MARGEEVHGSDKTGVNRAARFMIGRRFRDGKDEILSSSSYFISFDTEYTMSFPSEWLAALGGEASDRSEQVIRVPGGEQCMGMASKRGKCQ